LTVSAPNRDFGEALWLPFTANRKFKAAPRIFTGAQGMYYRTADGREVLDAIAGLWCVNAGHGQPRIVEAIKSQAEQLDFVSSFQMTHPAAFELADRLALMAPGPINHVFFSNSGSEAVDTALKIARAYHRFRGEGGRTRFIGRAKAYHGVGFGGISVGGIGRHRRDFGPLLPGVDHLKLPYDPEVSRFSRGQPVAGADYADELISLIQLNDASTIAAVIVEPITGSGGVFPPPVGYLEQLRKICTDHGILLIFDEVITGFGRLGANFAAEAFMVTPDIMTAAKGLTNGAVPMGATLVNDEIWEAFMAMPEDQIEFAHGYTYSAHPLACAAALAALEVYETQDIFSRAAATAPFWQEAVHSLKGLSAVIDIRNLGVLAAVELRSDPQNSGAMGAAVGRACFEKGILVRPSSDTLLMSPPLVISTSEIDRIVTTLNDILCAL
jgi:beta-alanine--pyruvate transaminase